jgi:hypothetical protein
MQINRTERDIVMLSGTLAGDMSAIQGRKFQPPGGEGQRKGKEVDKR